MWHEAAAVNNRCSSARDGGDGGAPLRTPRETLSEKTVGAPPRPTAVWQALLGLISPKH